MIQKMFSTMSPEGARFYHKIFNRVLLNMHAVKHGYFDTLFCETDDEKINRKWSAALPHIVKQLHVQTLQSFEEFKKNQAPPAPKDEA